MSVQVQSPYLNQSTNQFPVVQLQTQQPPSPPSLANILASIPPSPTKAPAPLGNTPVSSGFTPFPQSPVSQSQNLPYVVVPSQPLSSPFPQQVSPFPQSPQQSQQFQQFQPQQQVQSPINLASIPLSQATLGQVQGQLSPARPVFSPSTEATSDVSRTPLQFDLPVQDRASDGTIEQQLASRGYISKDKVIIRDANGQISSRYIKAVNDRGQTVLVDLDTDGNVVIFQSDLDRKNILIESKNGSNIPYSAMIGSYECAGMDVCGVAFECDGEVCTLTRTEAAEPKMVVLTTAEKIITRQGLFGDTPISYPIVRLSEILVDPIRVGDAIDKATRRIRAAAYEIALDELCMTEKALVEMNLSFQRLVNEQKRIYKVLYRTLEEVEQLRDRHLKSGLKCDADREKYRKVIYNLHRRHEMLVDLLRVSRETSNLRSLTLPVSEKMNELSEFLGNAFKGLEYTYTS